MVKKVSFANSSRMHESGNDQHEPKTMDDASSSSSACHHSCHYYHDPLSQIERKAICWYSPEDLQPCREEAKQCIHELQQRLEKGTLDSLPADVCLRGIEKYADTVGKFRKQRIFIESILQQQRAMKRMQSYQSQEAPSKQLIGDYAENLGNLSRYLSQPSTELALFYAARCAAELSLLRHEEEDGQDEEEEDDDDWEYPEEAEDSSSTCSSQIDVHESKTEEAPISDLSVSSSSASSSKTSSKRKRSRYIASFEDKGLPPPSKIQCCE